MLELDAVVKEYAGPGEVVRPTDGVSLTVARGEFVAIFGPSGSGKTTLLLLAGGLLRPDGGAIRFKGRDLSTLSRAEVVQYRRRDVGFIFQNFGLVPGISALDNVALRLKLDGVHRGEAERRARETLGLVGLAGRTEYPAFKLSGGEKQRVAIARALVGEPGVILADEPTGNLDIRHGGQVLSMLGSLARDRRVSVVLVTHDLRAIEYADRVLELSDGHLREREPDRRFMQAGTC